MGRLPSLVAHWSGTIDDNGQTAMYDITAARDGRYRRTYTLPLTQITDGSNLTQDWVQDENGNVQTAPAQHHESMDARLVKLNDLRFEEHDSEVTGTATIDGHPAYTVDVAMQDQSAVVYFDQSTGLLDGADVDGETIRYLAYRRFDGVAVPTDIQMSGPDDASSITVDSVAFVGESKNEFDPPAQRRPSFPAGNTQVALSFDSPHDLIVCQVLVDGHPARFIIDTGSTTSILDEDAAKRFGLATGGISHVEGAALMTGTVARIDTLNIGGVVYSPFFVQAIPLRLPSRLSHEGIDGVLGYDLFCSLVARISFPRYELRLIQSSAFSYTGTGAVLTIDTAKRVPLLSTVIGDADQGTFTVDTGSSATLVLYPEYADLHRSDFTEPYEESATIASGAGGDMPTRLYSIDRLKLGQFDITDVPTEVITREAGAFGGTASDGLIGSGALKQFNAVFFDYGGNRLILER
ncbi:MAG TPA: retroviral-like aspartic protease family protein [Candidatus Acidoferrales bacterium]|nr:retroviral-like aspartic protease family protein [Candidatus Acidoferrales bacterium]